MSSTPEKKPLKERLQGFMPKLLDDQFGKLHAKLDEILIELKKQNEKP